MKKRASGYAYSLLFLFVFLLNSVRSSATHIVAADMTYKWLSGTTYKVIIVLYGDCGPASTLAFQGLPLSRPQVCVFNGNNLFTSISLTIEEPICGTEITRAICPGTPTQCTDPASTIPGIKQFTFTGTVTLPVLSPVWRFIYNGSGGDSSGTVTCNGNSIVTGAPTSGRGTTITNIENAGNTIIQLIDTLDNSLHHNSNPDLTILPTPYYCVNTSNCYSPGAIDRNDSTALSPKGDSLVFTLVTAIDSRPTVCDTGVPVNYVGTAWSYPTSQPVTGANPLQVDSASQFNFDASTGQICFVPSLLQRSDVVYNIREFRNGIFIGTCQREMTFLVQPCTTSKLSAFYATSTLGTIKDSTDFQICSGAGDFSMVMNPSDDDPIANITVTSGAMPAGANFTTSGNGTTRPVCTFSWSTNGLDTGTYSYTITFTDDHCPYPGKLVRTYLIHVSAPLIITPTVKNDMCRTKSGVVQVAITGGSIPYSYQWSNGASGSRVAGLAEGVYTVTVADNTGCKNSKDISVGEDSVLLVITPTVKNDICKTGNGSIGIVTNGGLTPYKYQWSIDSTGNIVSGLQVGTYSVAVTDLNGCKNGLSVDVGEDVCPDVIIHDVITPNGDGVNDVLVIEGLQNYPKNVVQIFDKWGDKVYEQHAYNNDWSGKGTKGELLPDGTYFYLVKLNALNAAGGQNEFKGSLLIKR